MARTGAPHDVVVVGGGPAGLSAGLVLGRALRSTLIVDSGAPANAVSAEVGGLVGREGQSPAQLRELWAGQVSRHPSVELRAGEIVAAEPAPEGLALQLAQGDTVRTRTLLLAHGLRYIPPQLEGIDGLWGRGVLHCPFCDGWEVRNRPLAVYGDGQASVDQAHLVRGWTEEAVLCTGGPDRLDRPQREGLEAKGIRIRQEPVQGLEGADGRLERIRFAEGPPEEATALFVMPRTEQPSGLAAALGCELTDAGIVVCDADGRTGVARVFAAGDTAAAVRSVAIAVGTGARAAKAIVRELTVP